MYINDRTERLLNSSYNFLKKKYMREHDEERLMLIFIGQHINDVYSSMIDDIIFCFDNIKPYILIAFKNGRIILTENLAHIENDMYHSDNYLSRDTHENEIDFIKRVLTFTFN